MLIQSQVGQVLLGQQTEAHFFGSAAAGFVVVAPKGQISADSRFGGVAEIDQQIVDKVHVVRFHLVLVDEQLHMPALDCAHFQAVNGNIQIGLFQ